MFSLTFGLLLLFFFYLFIWSFLWCEISFLYLLCHLEWPSSFFPLWTPPSYPPRFPRLLSFQHVNIYGNPQQTKRSRSLRILTSRLSNIPAFVASAQESDGRSLTAFSRAWADSASVNSGWKPAAAHEQVFRPKCCSSQPGALAKALACVLMEALLTFRLECFTAELRFSVFEVLQLCTVTEEQIRLPEPFHPRKEEKTISTEAGIKSEGKSATI